MRVVLRTLSMLSPLSLVRGLFLFFTPPLPSSYTNTHQNREFQMPNPEQGTTRASEQVQKSIEKLNEASQKLEERIAILDSKIPDYVNLYFIFQGVIFSSVMSSSTTIKCELRWIPSALSLLVFIFNFVAINKNILKLLIYHEELDRNWEQLDLMRRALHDIGRTSDGSRERPVQPKENRNSRRCYTIYYPTLLLLLVFTGVMSYGCHQFGCHH